MIYNCEIVFIDRFFPSSKKCHICDEINKNLKLRDRLWSCEGCGVEHDRDRNASINILNEGMKLSKSVRTLTDTGVIIRPDISYSRNISHITL